MIITTIWETAYIFSRAPIDRAMIGFGVFGLLVYYLALFYRPLRLLDSMLANMASEIPEALFFFSRLFFRKKGGIIPPVNITTFITRLQGIICIKRG